MRRILNGRETIHNLLPSPTKTGRPEPGLRVFSEPLPSTTFGIIAVIGLIDEESYPLLVRCSAVDIPTVLLFLPILSSLFNF